MFRMEGEVGSVKNDDPVGSLFSRQTQQLFKRGREMRAGLNGVKEWFVDRSAV